MTAYAISAVEMLDETQGQRYRELGGPGAIANQQQR
jgi:hypothetical protein